MKSAVILLTAGFAVIGCGAQLAMPGGGGGGAAGTGVVNTGLGGVGGTGAQAGTGIVMTGLGGSGPCQPGPGVVACDDSWGLSLGLPSNGGAFVGGTAVMQFSHANWIRRRDTAAAAWTDLQGTRAGTPATLSLRVDSLGRPVVVELTHDDTGISVLRVTRQDGAGWTLLGEELWVVGQLSTGSSSKPLAGVGNGGAGFDLEIDALDRPVLLLTSGSQWGNQIAVIRAEGPTWKVLGGTSRINAVPAGYDQAHLAIDSADGVTPQLAYAPYDRPDFPNVVSARFDAATDSWSILPPLARGLYADFDLAVAGGVAFIAYLDGPTTEDARLFVSQGSDTGWSAGVPLNGETNRPAYAPRILATGPASTELVVGWQEVQTPLAVYQVLLKKAPDWSRVPGYTPPAGSDMGGFALAVDPGRLAIAWHSRLTTPPSIGYLEFAR